MFETKKIKSYTVNEAIEVLAGIQIGINGLESPMNYSLLLQRISLLLSAIVQYGVVKQIGLCEIIELPKKK